MNFGGNSEGGIFGILFGFVLLVLFGVTIGVLADKRLGFSSKKSEIEKDINYNAAHLTDLQREFSLLTERDQTSSQGLLTRERERKVLAITSQTSQNTLVEKRNQITQLHAEIAAVEKSFAKYQQTQRESTWSSAIGEALDSLTTVEGKTYENVVIKNVTAHGMEISHKNGFSLIESSSLPASWSQRFHWFVK